MNNMYRSVVETAFILLLGRKCGCGLIPHLSTRVLYASDELHLGRMERFRCLPTARRVVDDSSDEVGEWIPTRQEFIQVYKDVGMNRDKPRIPTSCKIGKRTFVEGCLDTVLLLACWAGNVSIVSYLLTSYMQYFSLDTLIDKLAVLDFKRALRGCKTMARFQQLMRDKVSLLHAAAEGLQLDVLKLLLSAGASVNNSSKWIVSPLISALLHSGRVTGLRRVVVYLIDSGADVNCGDADGKTPLMYAASRFVNGVDLVQMLKKAGANAYAMDSEGFTALHHACKSKRTEVVKYLLKIAPDLLLLRGKPSLACLAPYLSILR